MTSFFSVCFLFLPWACNLNPHSLLSLQFSYQVLLIPCLGFRASVATCSVRAAEFFVGGVPRSSFRFLLQMHSTSEAVTTHTFTAILKGDDTSVFCMSLTSVPVFISICILYLNHRTVSLPTAKNVWRFLQIHKYYCAIIFVCWDDLLWILLGKVEFKDWKSHLCFGQESALWFYWTQKMIYAQDVS